MKKEQSFEARVQLTARMQQGQSWIASAAATGLHVSQSTAYRLLQGYRMQGSAALQDGRHGHRSLLRGAARTFLEEQCRQAPQTASSTMQMELRERFDLSVSIRKTQPRPGGTRCQQPSQALAAGEKKTDEGSAFPQPEWQEGAGSLLLLAAAQQTELLPRRESALSPNLLTTAPSLRLAHSQPETLHKQLLTLLFLQGVGLRQTWDETKLHRSGSGLTHRSPPRLWLSPHRAVFSGVSSRGSR